MSEEILGDGHLSEEEKAALREIEESVDKKIEKHQNTVMSMEYEMRKRIYLASERSSEITPIDFKRDEKGDHFTLTSENCPMWFQLSESEREFVRHEIEKYLHESSSAFLMMKVDSTKVKEYPPEFLNQYFGSMESEVTKLRKKLVEEGFKAYQEKNDKNKSQNDGEES